MRIEAKETGRIGNAVGLDPAEKALIAWLDRADAFKQAQYRVPENAIPELALLTEEDWLELAKKNEHLRKVNLPTVDPQINRNLLKIARQKAKLKFGFLLRAAIDRYRAANNDMLPSDIQLLRAYFAGNDPHLGGDAELVNDEMLNRYKVLQTGTFTKVAEKDVIIAELAPADSNGDTRLVIGKDWLNTAGKYDAGYWETLD